ncbi:hypothetical protein [Nitrosospira multiformis]|uniref:Uncharacterized protein n=1 Tax=Nitrosospira multiformis (strain ATCC 25196 / NCIMB 11849 / C 71) TaxID=323848 RepID=A0A1H5XDV0_NITMU|nr:hypothetical protein [Nitrosospira multiformis]SEA70093.1 hypothetical protein SAMN05216411_12027 [Nitrosospira multiformis]SEG09376.1 hypothetical protein SAMN05216403_1297 [Nitrosospira multiformis ATCC 25196]
MKEKTGIRDSQERNALLSERGNLKMTGQHMRMFVAIPLGFTSP